MTEVELKQLALKEKEFRSERIKTGNSTHWHENASNKETAHTGTEMLQNRKQRTLARKCFMAGNSAHWHENASKQETVHIVTDMLQNAHWHGNVLKYRRGGSINDLSSTSAPSI